jgi:hypothetical protein
MEQLDECVRERGSEKGAALLQEARERGAKLAADGKPAALLRNIVWFTKFFPIK